MRTLTDRTDIDQLRHQAREFLRAAGAGDPDAIYRLRTVSPRTTLWAAQLALAREHGFGSWRQLKLEIERRRTLVPSADSPASYPIRPVASMNELVSAFDLVGEQFEPNVTHKARRFQDLARRFTEDQRLMLIVESRGRIVGGAFAFRKSRLGVTLRMIALQPGARGRGLGRRLIEAIELEAARLGAGEIALGGAGGDVKGFYTHLGYSGRGSMMSKGLPLPGRLLEARLRRLSAVTRRGVGIRDPTSRV